MISMSPTQHVLISGSQLGQILQSARKARKLSQAELGSRIGLSQSRVSYLELNAQELSVDQLLAWCAALGLEFSLGPRGAAASADSQTEW
ncbi:helix-turn-helix domain-containing protein [Thauera sp.]|uniref:helix-turn-helix domain-containing protein n=1 Tax=Thauera sp. TaxID=1905334 RepID=UPI0039E457EF